MIKVGTICYLTGYHSRAGECCTVISGLYWHSNRRHNATGTPLPPAYVHKIRLASGDGGDHKWHATPSVLIPISDPDQTQDTRTDEPAHA